MPLAPQQSPTTMRSRSARKGKRSQASQEQIPTSPDKVESWLTQPLAAGYQAQRPLSVFYSDSFDLPIFHFYWDLEAMRRYPVCIQALEYHKSGIANAEHKVTGKRQQWVDFMKDQIKRFWRNDLSNVQAGYDYGWLGSEVVYRLKDNFLQYDSMLTFAPREVQVLLKKGVFAGVRVNATEGDQQDIPDLWGPHKGAPAKGFWYTHRPEFGRWYGTSQLYGAWRPWRRLAVRDGGEEIIDGAIYRFGITGPKARYPETSADFDGNPHRSERHQARDIAIEMAEKSKAGASIALPSTPNLDGTGFAWDIEFPQHTLQVSPLIEYANYLEQWIIKAVLIPPELLEASETGSGWSGRRIPQEMYLTQQQRIGDAITKAFVEQVGIPLLKWNFGPDAEVEVEMKSLLETQNKRYTPEQPGMGGAAPPGGDMGGGMGGLGDMLGGGGSPEGGEMGGEGEEQSLGDLIDTLSTAPPKTRRSRLVLSLSTALPRLKELNEAVDWVDRSGEHALPEGVVIAEDVPTDPGRIQRVLESFGPLTCGFDVPEVRVAASGHEEIFVPLVGSRLAELWRLLRSAGCRPVEVPGVVIARTYSGAGDKYAHPADDLGEIKAKRVFLVGEGQRAPISLTVPAGLTQHLGTLSPTVRYTAWLGARYEKVPPKSRGVHFGKVVEVQGDNAWKKVGDNSSTPQLIYSSTDPNQPASKRKSQKHGSALKEVVGIMRRIKEDPTSVKPRDIEALKRHASKLDRKTTDKVRGILDLPRAGRLKMQRTEQLANKIADAREDPDSLTDKQLKQLDAMIAKLSPEEKKALKKEVEDRTGPIDSTEPPAWASDPEKVKQLAKDPEQAKQVQKWIDKTAQQTASEIDTDISEMSDKDTRTIATTVIGKLPGVSDKDQKQLNKITSEGLQAFRDAEPGENRANVVTKYSKKIGGWLAGLAQSSGVATAKAAFTKLRSRLGEAYSWITSNNPTARFMSMPGRLTIGMASMIIPTAIVGLLLFAGPGAAAFGAITALKAMGAPALPIVATAVVGAATQFASWWTLLKNHQKILTRAATRMQRWLYGKEQYYREQEHFRKTDRSFRRAPDGFVPQYHEYLW